MAATEQYFLVMLLIVPYKVVLTFDFVQEILKYHHSNYSSLATAYCTEQGSSNFKGKLRSSTFP